MISRLPLRPRWAMILMLAAVVVAGATLVGAVTLRQHPHPRAAVRPEPGSVPTQRSSQTSWPNGRNTGARGDLSPMPGGTVSTDGTTLENVSISGQLVITADNVTLRNVHVKSHGWFGVLVYGKHALVEDTTIEGAVGTEAGLAADKGGQFVARRVNVFRFEDGVRLGTGSSLYDSYVHDLVGTKDAHFDGVTADGHVDWEIVHNTIMNQNDQTAAVWVGDPRFSPSSGLLKDNLLAGGGYTVYAGPGVAPGVRVVGNFFSTRYFPKSGGYGPVAKWDPKGNTWAGNTWADGPLADRPVTP